MVLSFACEILMVKFCLLLCRQWENKRATAALISSKAPPTPPPIAAALEEPPDDCLMPADDAGVFVAVGLPGGMGVVLVDPRVSRGKEIELEVL
jgi:hypothetical protein